jgi:hypothetical protein
MASTTPKNKFHDTPPTAATIAIVQADADTNGRPETQKYLLYNLKLKKGYPLLLK